MKKAGWIAGTLLLLAIAACGWLWLEVRDFLDNAPETPGHEVLVDVLPGARLSRVAKDLQAKGVVTDDRKFELLARFKDVEHRIQAGRFAMHTGWLPEKVLDVLVNGSPLLHRITVPEGLTWWQTGTLLANAGFVDLAAFTDAVLDPELLRRYGIPFVTAEGFLMPDTYLLKKPDTPDARQTRSVVGRLLDNFWRKSATVWPDGKKPGVEDLRHYVILASIVEKETGRPEERARVAGVYRNRLARRMPLQADPTVIYGLGPAFGGNLRRTHLDDPSNPYNTYQHPGLPPGPICSFGVSSLAAAVRPEAHGYLYFVAVTDGGEHAFSTTLAEHNKAVRRYLQNRRAASSKE
ncbi:MAG: endolytic transglycosylase MltG [Desulfovibrio sp.]|nr:endolytic transglycosylase MltG [Desulfovibrio sp.]